MGAKTWMLVYSEGDPRAVLATRPTLDRAATKAFAERLFPKERLVPLEDGSVENTCPPDDELVVGVFAGVRLVAAREFALDLPSKLPARFLEEGRKGLVHLHAMHSVVDWSAFARWRDGKLERALSLAPDEGVLEDVGERLAFEAPYWSGEHPAIDPDEDDAEYPFPFHPLELGEAALLAFFGYVLEGDVSRSSVDPTELPLLRFQRKRSLLRWFGG